MQAFHNDKAIKKIYVDRVTAHAKADEIIKGVYWRGGKGCAIGCTIHNSSHASYETELGIPQILARLEDKIFESLPNKEAQKWPLQFLKAIPLGADLSKVWHQYVIWLLVDTVYGVIKYAKSDACRKAIQDVADAYSRTLAGEKISSQEWYRLQRNAAADAAYDVDVVVVAAAAAYAAYAADAAAVYDVVVVAAADAADAKSKHWIAQSKKLIQLLKAAK